MDKVNEIEVKQPDGEIVTFVVIDKGDGNFASMPKADYEKQLAEKAEQSGTL